MDSPFFFENTRYWSEGDERCHFDWLARIDCVRAVKGEGRRVYLDVDSARARTSDLIELKAVYRRYRGDLDQLKRLEAVELER